MGSERQEEAALIDDTKHANFHSKYIQYARNTNTKIRFRLAIEHCHKL